MTVVRIKSRDARPHKATTSPDLGARTVLTNSHWEYVSLWLRREHETRALVYWQQAQIFANAAERMPVSSAPLLHYYTFMNATKALLYAKGLAFREHHGVRAHNMRGPSSKIALSNEGVSLMQHGVAPELSRYLGEAETRTQHSLEELLFNLPCIHRTFCLTYKNQSDMFVPLHDCQIAYDPATASAYFSARLSKDFSGKKYIKRLPQSLILDPSCGENLTIKSRLSIPLPRPMARTATEISSVVTLLRSLRPDINYIAGAQTLWYVKAVVPGPSRLQRSPLTCTLLAMHRLSEICRYRPMELASFLSGQKNWLLTEFIRMAPFQFLDEISAELTGQQFMIPNVRPAS